MPTIREWLVVKGLSTVNKVLAVCGDQDAKALEAKLKVEMGKIKTMHNVHEYAKTRDLTHDEAAEELDVALDPELREKYSGFDKGAKMPGYYG